MWNSQKMWNKPKEMEQRKDEQYFSVLSKKTGVALDVEQAFDVDSPKMWNRPEEVEQRKGQQCLAVLSKKGASP